MAISNTSIVTKICNKCNIEKPLNCFWKNTGYNDGYVSTCSECYSAIRRKNYRENPKIRVSIKNQKRLYYIKNKDRVLEQNKRWQEQNSGHMKQYRKKLYQATKTKRRDAKLQAAYGISLIDYNEMFIIQNGRCAICGKHQTELNRRLHVDHNHETGEVRGLLCSFCNTAIGSLSEDISILQKAILYLEKN